MFGDASWIAKRIKPYISNEILRAFNNNFLSSAILNASIWASTLKKLSSAPNKNQVV